MKKIYNKDTETDHFLVDFARTEILKRTKICSLRNAIEVNIDGKLFCMAHVGQRKHKDALQLCQGLNATLPLPKSNKEHQQLIENFKRFGIDKKMKYFSTKIVLDVRRMSNKGKVSLFLVFSLFVNDSTQLS